MQTGIIDRYNYEQRKSRMHGWLVENFETIVDREGVSVPVTFDLLDRMSHVDPRSHELTTEEVWLREQYTALRRLYHASCVFPYKEAEASAIDSIWRENWPFLLFLGTIVVGLAILWLISY